MKNELLRYGKALGALLGAFLTSILSSLYAKPGPADLGDLTTADWLTAVVAALALSGLTAAIPKGDELARVDRHGVVRAGPAARQQTGDAVGGGTPVVELVRDEDSRGVGR
jgi:hypothetical protein